MLYQRCSLAGSFLCEHDMIQGIELLLDQLARSNKDNGGSSNESKRIRRKLRSLGHYGGLRGK
jgi:hypothetical protein